MRLPQPILNTLPCLCNHQLHLDNLLESLLFFNINGLLFAQQLIHEGHLDADAGVWLVVVSIWVFSAVFFQVVAVARDCFEFLIAQMERRVRQGQAAPSCMFYSGC